MFSMHFTAEKSTFEVDNMSKTRRTRIVVLRTSQANENGILLSVPRIPDYDRGH